METNESRLSIRLNQILELPKWIFGISLAIGTILFCVFVMDVYRDNIILIGFLYVLAAVFINAVTFATLAVCAYLFKDYRNQILNKAAILFINIPVAILYYYLMLAAANRHII